MQHDLLAASKIIQEVVQGKNIEKLFNQYIGKNHNISLVKDIVYGSIRDIYLNEYFLNKLISVELKNLDIKYLLLNAFYQLSNQSIKSFTIVNENVKAAKLINNKFSGLVNGVLRNFLRKKPEFQDPFELRLKYSYPEWWVEKLKNQYPQDYEAILKIGNTRAPIFLRVNVKKITHTDYINQLEKNNIKYELILDKNYIQINESINVQNLPGFVEGLIYIQDPAAQLAINFLDLKNDLKILDLCAAPGGKATHILERFNVLLDCYDINEERLSLIRDNLNRLGLQANILSQLKTSHQYDRILIDAPCSGSGVVRRNVDIKIMRREEDIKKFQNQQMQLLEQGWSHLKKNGKLLYITCSIFNDENEDVIRLFLKKHTDVTLEKIHIPKDFSFIDSQLIPNSNHDGLFFQLLTKN
ncbi:MAG: 16S rRNA (cytosine(967)-C(5))-methyltransferase RsmB [Methylophilaceae bacterium]|mgnify:FL=1|jgi:16S rRNA (cytosine967-C5)-methyltransferase